MPFLSIYDGKDREARTNANSHLSSKKVGKDRGQEPSEDDNCGVDRAVKNGFEGNVHTIKVDGEEDLAAVACMVLAPYGTNIVYGWPGKGMKLVTTDEQVRKEAELLIEMMEEL